MTYSSQHLKWVSRIVAVFSFAASLLWASAALEAGKIKHPDGLTWHTGVASVGAEPIPAPSPPNNDDVDGDSPNVIFLPQKNYVGIGPVDLVFEVEDTGGVTEYLVREGVANSTGLTWIGYRVELGFGHGDDFVKSLSDDGLDFDAPDFNSDVGFSTWFPTWVVYEDEIVASGTMPSPAYSTPPFYFHIDVPDGITSFTLRQTPIAVPEPSTWVLSGFGLSVLYYFRCREKAAQVRHRFKQ